MLNNETRTTNLEAEVLAIKSHLSNLETKIDTLLEVEAERKATEKIMTKYSKFAFWMLISIGGFINWEKIDTLIGSFFHHQVHNP